jgi:transcriptional regulator with XRE-family HTH domain
MRLRNPEITNNNDNIGSILKHHRLKLNLTLEDSAEGICSISYLSKIENSLIRPSQKYLLQLEERYNTNFQFQPTTHQEVLNRLVENIFFEQNELMDEVLFEDENYQTKLNEIGYLVSQNSFETARHIHQNLNPYIKNLNDIELSFYLFLTSKLLSRQGRLKEAFSILGHVNLDMDNLYLKLLIETEKFMLATKMNHHPYISLSYEHLKFMLIENELYQKLNKIKFSYMAYLVQFIHESKLDEILERSKHYETYQKNYLRAKYYYEHMQYELSYKLLKEQMDDMHSYKLALMSLNRLNHLKDIKKFIQNFDSIENTHLKILIKYLQMKSNSKINIEEIVEFIQSEILKNNDLPDEIDYLNFWYEEGYMYLRKIGYYKDATKLSHLIFRKFKDLSTNFD